MGKCDHCGSTILWGAVKQDGLKFCNEKCLQEGIYLSLASHVPSEVAEAQVRAVHHDNCPVCHGPGPVDVYTSHTVWSAFIVTSWQSHPKICCRKCGRIANVQSAALSLLVGWWGIPWGIIATPIQVARNLGGFFAGPSSDEPSPALRRAVLTGLGARLREIHLEEKAKITA